jgi:hypothetical protein
MEINEAFEVDERTMVGEQLMIWLFQSAFLMAVARRSRKGVGQERYCCDHGVGVVDGSECSVKVYLG